ncbi:hypothetical protein [Massilia sp. Leaf139]|uniref:hypothetical protein n=1 Tax=Massilia sp. Leaf139 TaxID=1736272 RepID=UPI00070055BF|nr:hypothetical protein [Massilia sp. Leaf139]KQQ97233.1 hypothetical protein ASF77_04575 [Massilia sp. Leaf139]
MKKSIALFCFALSTAPASAAQPAEDSTAFCTQLASDIAARSALFSTVVHTTPGLADIGPSAPADMRQRAHDKEVALHDIAKEIWSLRTRMAYLDCAQARTFTY